MNNQWNTKIVGIPYRGGGPAAQALAANDVQVTRFGVGNFTGLLEGGKVKALAVGLPTRSPLLPDVPTLDEAGLAGIPGPGLVGSRSAARHAAGHRRAAQQRIREAVQRAEVQGVPRQAGGGRRRRRTPAGFAAFLKEDRKAAETLIRIANTKPAEYKPEK